MRLNPKFLTTTLAALFGVAMTGTAIGVEPPKPSSTPNPSPSPESTRGGVGASAVPETKVMRDVRPNTPDAGVRFPTPQGQRPNPSPSPESTETGIGAGIKVK